jgi:radical SAM-linked protein
LKETITIEFNIRGDLRFLSHQETVSLFRLALVRSGVPLLYSEGYNPRPRLSLPLPRSVGLAAEGEMLCFQVETAAAGRVDCDAMAESLQGELPEGIELGSATAAAGRLTLTAESVEYVFELKAEAVERVRLRIAALAGAEDIHVLRHQPKKGTDRQVNVGDFVESAAMEDCSAIVRCRLTEAGAVRVDELMRILEIEQPMLAGAVTRRNVRWQRRN